ncbi:hypothetical protein QE431_002743 [Flavobacterium sp. SORGH_AS 622]|nr:hypothetical protein [Flavobacterium sp. SORGH_AS_0622]
MNISIFPIDSAESIGIGMMAVILDKNSPSCTAAADK